MASIHIVKEGLDVTVEVTDEVADQITRLVVGHHTSAPERRGAKTKASSEQQGKIIELAKQGWVATNIATELDLSYWTVRRLMKAQGF
jgi:DNA-binding NarL/FixJ family response regulator